MAGDDKNRVDPNAWMVTFGDLLMLLLTFFVLLLTMKVVDGQTSKRFFEYFVQTRDLFQYTDESVSESRQDVSLKKRYIVNQAMLRKTLRKDYGDFKRYFGVYETGQGVMVTLDTEFLFEPGKAEIRPDRLEILDMAGRLFSGVSNEIVITGHTDDTSPRGRRFRSNWELSLYRSLAVFDYLTREYGLDPARIATAGGGSARPLVPNVDRQSRARNRRVEFLLRKK